MDSERERGKITGGPIVPRSERRQAGDRNELLRTFAKIAGPVAGLSAVGYAAVELTPNYSVDDFTDTFLDSSSYAGVLENTDTGELASQYSSDLVAYSMEHSGEVAQYTQDILNGLG